MNAFWLCFVPLFVAVDAVGILPLFFLLTEGMEPARRRVVIVQSIFTATLVALLFLALGPALLRFLGITISDFMIAGGVLLFAISLGDVLTDDLRQRASANANSLGAVPLGVPLITGPAVLTTCLLLAGMYGSWMTALALVLNLALLGVFFLFVEPITRVLGQTGSKALSKVASLLLAAIAVMLIRRGVVNVILEIRP